MATVLYGECFVCQWAMILYVNGFVWRRFCMAMVLYGDGLAWRLLCMSVALYGDRFVC